MVSYQGASASGKEIVIILIAGAGLVIVFYMLAKREAENAIGGIGKGVSDAVQGIKNEVASTITGAQTAVVNTAVGAGQTVSQVVSLPPLTEHNVTGTLAEDILDTFTPVGYPTHKIFKNGKWYILYGCDISGHNCSSEREPLFPYEGAYLPEVKT